MSETTVTAIVLRRRNSGESDRRLTLLTPEFGKIDVVAKGARKAASRLAGVSDPLTMAKMSLAKGKVNHFVTQAQPQSAFKGLRTDFDRLSLALALLELYTHVLPFNEPQEGVFNLLLKSLHALESHPKAIVALVWAELQLMEESGFLPPFDLCISTGEKVSVAEPWLSPVAGGHVAANAADAYSDRFRTRSEVLIGLARTAERTEPPANLKFAEECLIALIPFWRHILDVPLPANEAVKREFRHAHLA